MNVSDLLNPLPNNSNTIVAATSSSHQHKDLHHLHQQHLQHQNVIGKPRSRFSEYEDNIIRRGVAQRLTWGQISDLLPHRKRATCFNRYRTLQGIRKSRKMSEANSPEMSSSSSSLSPTSPVASCFSDPKTPPTSNYAQSSWYTPPMYESKYKSSSYATEISSNTSDSSSDNDDFPFPAQITMTKRQHKIALPSLSSYRHHPYHHRPTSSSNAIQPLY